MFAASAITNCFRAFRSTNTILRGRLLGNPFTRTRWRRSPKTVVPMPSRYGNNVPAICTNPLFSLDFFSAKVSCKEPPRSREPSTFRCWTVEMFSTLLRTRFNYISGHLVLHSDVRPLTGLISSFFNSRAQNLPVMENGSLFRNMAMPYIYKKWISFRNR